MLSKNNSNPAVCVNNLLQIARGEVPYDRVKGIGIAQLDAPVALSADDIVEDAEWMLATYEPRAEVDEVEVTPTDAPNGHFSINAKINTTKEVGA